MQTNTESVQEINDIPDRNTIIENNLITTERGNRDKNVDENDLKLSGTSDSVNNPSENNQCSKITSDCGDSSTVTDLKDDKNMEDSSLSHQVKLLLTNLKMLKSLHL